ncbi:MAG: metalloregulator ArsR/SmtB family transcription factor [Bacteroidota bacterium]|nr:metalloregulator ArsR/SmtB family transcription factor [Bacteroidota bacterium]MDP3146126.1 metalloregulator ArsR/SmtB family transcription factor [Bacteroidota bacterium]MDP3556716.1 metalloregulator ArsR/SmtB family transcription factor [Bacteroidota bacterium]
MSIKESKLQNISESLKAVAHPDRIRILKFLAENKETKKSVSKICVQLKLKQPEVSRHLSILKNKEVVQFQRGGNNIYYSVNKNSFVFSCIQSLIKSI